MLNADIEIKDFAPDVSFPVSLAVIFKAAAMWLDGKAGPIDTADTSAHRSM